MSGKVKKKYDVVYDEDKDKDEDEDDEMGVSAV